MSQFDPDNPFDDPRPPKPLMGPFRPTSGLAIASLVCGVMFCVPMVASTLAVAFGVAGLRRTRDGHYGGRGMAISGLILGIAGIGLWLFLGSVIYVAAQTALAEQAKAEAVANRFVQELSEGKVDAAAALALPGLDRAKLSASADAMKAGGPFNELSGDFQLIPSRRTMDFRWELEGDAVFSRDRKPVRMGLSKDGSGDYRVDRFEME